MSILTRAKQLIFGDNGTLGEFGVIGSKASGVPAKSKDIATMQSDPLYLNGLFGITSDQTTSRLPYSEDINSLFYLVTSQLKYLFQNGVPEYDPDTEYFENISFVQDEGVIWVSNNGDAITPNVGNKPSTNQDKWDIFQAKKISEGVVDSQIFTPGFEHAQLVGDTTLGDAAITIGDGKFLNQELTLSNHGTGFATFTHPDFSYGIIVDPDHDPVIKWVSDGIGGFKWDVGSQVSAEYFDSTQELIIYSDNILQIEGATTSSVGIKTTGVVYKRSFSSIVIPVISLYEGGGSDASLVTNYFSRSNTTTDWVFEYIGSGGTTQNIKWTVRGEYA